MHRLRQQDEMTSQQPSGFVLELALRMSVMLLLLDARSGGVCAARVSPHDIPRALRTTQMASSQRAIESYSSRPTATAITATATTANATTVTATAAAAVATATTAAVHPQAGCTCSPYRLSFASAVQTAIGSRYCFVVGFRGCEAPDGSRPCCDAMARGSVDSLLLRTGVRVGRRHQSQQQLRRQQQQQQAVTITGVVVNGSIWHDWSLSEQPARPESKVGAVYTHAVRLSGLAADSTTFPGTTICLTTTTVTTAATAIAIIDRIRSGARTDDELCDEEAGGCRFAVAAAPSTAGISTADDDDSALCSVQPGSPLLRRRARLAEATTAATANAAAAAAARPMPSSSTSQRPNAIQQPPRRQYLPPPFLRKHRFPPSPRPTPNVRQPPGPRPSPPATSSPPQPSVFGLRSSDAANFAFGTGISRVCGSVSLASPLDPATGVPTYTFGTHAVSCDRLAAWMAANLTDAARRAGAALSLPFAPDSCTSDTLDRATEPPVTCTLTVCGAFASVAEAAKIQDRLDPLLAHWRYLAMGLTVPPGDEFLYICPPAGVQLRTMIFGSGEPGAPFGWVEVQCGPPVLFATGPSSDEIQVEAEAGSSQLP